MEGKLERSGEDFLIRISAAEGLEHGLREGQTVELRPRPPRRETWADMIGEMDRLGQSHRPEPVDWGPDVGAEIVRDD
ncbi:MazF family transcriptional regulator [Methylobacterium trifolii]|uniref:AbrB/MazE/SpoVT family DNA-binding domain-containing protein n=1 Tax=Methylobacterium trifolii TaxID=1003092 RepID=A0ABQ4TV41_9HYPH|nr:MazF family transcriptional regulator [Methylobacterium trifolii]GJE58324.1 hypothetical protein MPOCJGCO_0403 [Methylobacterium trifolii]